MNATQAARVFNRVYAPIAERRSLAEDADAGFDAGEWSGPAHARDADREYVRTLRSVARRVNVRPKAIHNELMRQANESTFSRGK